MHAKIYQKRFMRHFLSFSVLLLALALPIMAELVVLEEIIVKANNDIILRSEYERTLGQIRAEVIADSTLSASQREELLEEREKYVLRDMIDNRLLIQKGEELGINVEAQLLQQRDNIMESNNIETTDEFEAWVLERTGEPVEDLMDRMRENYLAQAVIGQEVSRLVIVTRDEVEAYFEEHKDEFVRAEGVRLSQIFFQLEGKTELEQETARTQAKEVYERVIRGEPFAEMARRFSEDEATKELGGDIGIYRRGMLRSEIEEAVFNQNRGFITDILEVPNGLLFLRVDQVFREGLAELEEVVEEIRTKLSAPLFPPAIREYLSELRMESYIEIRPGYADSGAIEGINTAWSDPSRLAPATTTREEVIQRRPRKRLLFLIPLPKKNLGEKDSDSDPASSNGEPGTA